MFTPRREHARFCSAACRVAWNREHTGNPQAGTSALDWSVTAMHDAVERLAREQPPDQAHGTEMISAPERRGKPFSEPPGVLDPTPFSAGLGARTPPTPHWRCRLPSP